MSTGKKSLVDLLGNNYSCAAPTVLTGDFARNILTLVPDDNAITGQPPITTSTKASIPDGHEACQVPIILPLFGDHEITQGSISDDKVHESISAYHPIGKLWADTVRHSATTDETFQLIADDVTPSLVNLSPKGTFHQDIEIDLSHNESVLARLEKGNFSQNLCFGPLPTFA